MSADTYNPAYYFEQDSTVADYTNFYYSVNCVYTGSEDLICRLADVFRLFSQMGMPIPDFSNVIGTDGFGGYKDTFEFWSAIFEWEPLRAFALFWLSNTYFFGFAFAFGYYHW